MLIRKLTRRSLAGLGLLVVGLWLPARAQAAFPFTISGSQFLRSGQPVFLNILSYQPLEPGQSITGEIRETRVLDDLRRLGDYQGGGDAVVLRVYAQPTPEFPQRMPRAFYDGVRDLGFFVIRDIYFDPDFPAPDAIDRGKAKVDAVIAEVESAGGLDVVFAWEIGNEFVALNDFYAASLVNFLCAMRDHIKLRMHEPARQGFSDWVTWAAWPPTDPLRTSSSDSGAATPVLPLCLDYISYNAYSYDPERMRDHQAGPVTGTPYAGYLAALKARYPALPLVVSETGLPDSPSAVGQDQASLHPWAPAYRRGALTGDQVAEGLADRYWDARLTGFAAGMSFFEWNDEWHKVTEPLVQDDDPEEYFGLMRFSGDPLEARFKLQQDTVRSLFTLTFSEAGEVLAQLTADQLTLPTGGSTTLRATLASTAASPVRFRWEASRGYVVGESATPSFFAGDVALGPVQATVVAIDAQGRANRAALELEIGPDGPPAIDLLTLGFYRASGRVRNVDLGVYKLVVYIETNVQYMQPFEDVTDIWIGRDGYWWTQVWNTFGGTLWVYVVPRDYVPGYLPKGVTPPGTLVAAWQATINDSNSDLLPDGLPQGRYADPDGDGAHNLDEFLRGTNPAVADNDADADGLPDDREIHYFGRLVYGAVDDPDSDGLQNTQEFALALHPGRQAADRDRDHLPDLWEYRFFGNLDRDGTGDFNGDGSSDLDAYELGQSPTSGASEVRGRFAFYNASGWDGGGLEASAADDLAVATDKVALLPGTTATFANYTGYSRGLNGVMVDIAGLPAVPTAADFTFKVGNNSAPSGWAVAPAPSSVTVRAGAGVGGSDRVTLIWANNAIQKQWLEVTVKATANTGLAADDVFYFGNTGGECGNSAGDALVTSLDLTQTRNAISASSVPVTSRFDHNRDGRVTSLDLTLCRNRISALGLRLITVPALPDP